MRDRDDGPDAVADIRTRASSSSQWLSAWNIRPNTLDEGTTSVDSRAIAEAIMKRIVPDLYSALVDAGEIEE